MKKISIFVAIVLVILILIYGAIFVFANAQGKDLLISAIRDNFGIQANIKEFSFRFPFSVRVKEFECEDLSLKTASVSLGFYNPFTYHLSLRAVRLEGLRLKIVKDEKGVCLSPFTADTNLKSRTIATSNFDSDGSNHGQKARLANDSSVADNTKSISVTINDFYLQDSSIEVTNKDRRFMQIILGDISLHVRGFTYPRFSKFKLKGSTSVFSTFDSEKVAGRVRLDGWVNYQKKNMDLNLKIDNFDYSMFNSYYPLSCRVDNIGIREASFSLSSNLVSEDNDLTIDSTLSLDKIEYMRKEEAGDSAYSKAGTIRTVVACFRNNQGKTAINFQIKTKMDSPNLDFSSLKNKISGAFNINPFTILKTLTGGTKDGVVKGAGKMEDLTIGTMIDTFKNIGDNFTDIFKNKEKSSSE